eukprot:TRINITY_DN34430_c0_g1_i1.p4 TRINITY_DN34430_c0_g1~~TRINITY_DN34430_c0_g1_i1.p4  ORF type:complete len:105 (-),score=18.21 TRINITY_DN34430_c0_g1_i1:172-486(-)
MATPGSSCHFHAAAVPMQAMPASHEGKMLVFHARSIRSRLCNDFIHGLDDFRCASDIASSLDRGRSRSEDTSTACHKRQLAGAGGANWYRKRKDAENPKKAYSE